MVCEGCGKQVDPQTTDLCFPESHYKVYDVTYPAAAKIIFLTVLGCIYLPHDICTSYNRSQLHTDMFVYLAIDI